MDPGHPRAAYARGEAIPDGFKRYGVAVDRGVSAPGEFDRSAAGMADARDRESDIAESLIAMVRAHGRAPPAPSCELSITRTLLDDAIPSRQAARKRPLQTVAS